MPISNKLLVASVRYDNAKARYEEATVAAQAAKLELDDAWRHLQEAKHDEAMNPE